MNIRPYLGLPWERMARGPHSFDCWGLVRYVYKKEFDIDLPLHIVAPERLNDVVRTMRSKLATDWVKLSAVRENCLVVMSSKKQPHHVGICISVDEELVLHCANTQGTTCQKISHIKNLMSVQSVSYYIPQQWRISSYSQIQ